MKILMLFFDGFGLGEENSHNPLFWQKTPTFCRLLEGRPLTMKTPPFHGTESTLLACDASLGWPGLPQSATGQTALFTGVNPLPIVGGHQSGFPGPALKRILGKKGIFTRLKAMGLKGTFANAYRPAFFSRLKEGHHRHFSVTTMMVMQAEIPFRTLDQLIQGQALYQDIDHSILHKNGHTHIPPISHYEAGKRLARISADYDFTLFEYFLTDIIGHARNRSRALQIVKNLDSFLEGILHFLDRENTLLFLTSDHGNIEDLRINTHTHHPVPALMVGPNREEMSQRIHSLLSITPAILDLIGNNTEKNHE